MIGVTFIVNTMPILVDVLFFIEGLFLFFCKGFSSILLFVRRIVVLFFYVCV